MPLVAATLACLLRCSIDRFQPKARGYFMYKPVRAFQTVFYSLAASLSLALVLTGALASPTLAQAQLDPATRQLSRDIFQQLIEINSTDSVGSTTIAAEAMQKRLLDAGFPKEDVVVLGPNSRKGNMVARLHGTGAGRPILLIGHLDVVEARREDWTTDPFQFVEKDGYFYGRGYPRHEERRRHHGDRRSSA